MLEVQCTIQQISQRSERCGSTQNILTTFLAADTSAEMPSDPFIMARLHAVSAHSLPVLQCCVRPS